MLGDEELQVTFEHVQRTQVGKPPPECDAV